MSESYLALGGIIIDDLVYEDGTTSMGVLGGGGLYAALGSRIWSEDVCMVARVGRDFNVTSISEKGLHTEYIELTSLPTPRAWQLLDSNDERTQIMIYQISVTSPDCISWGEVQKLSMT